MGTRNMTGVILDGEFVVSQYCQWDGYPEGQGTLVLSFLKGTYDRETFLKGLKNRVVLTPEQVESLQKSEGVEIEEHGNMKLISVEDARRFAEVYPTLDRDHGALILRTIQDSAESGDPVYVEIETSFYSDSLFCEWAYILDLDNEVLEVYRGFNKKPLKRGQRFRDSPKARAEYHPVRCIKQYRFDALPDIQEFVDTLSSLANR